MPIKKGTKCHRYTDEDYERISRGDYLEGISIRSQVYAYERQLKRIHEGKKKYKHNNYREVENEPFTPLEDLCVIDDEFPPSKNVEICRKRKQYLFDNFINVGWGSLIGTQRITW